ncbi:hypothetical protein J1605_015313 [Eschrichtius robustus]|uniref:Uncharacterized protein n=1 Tax=Eschrichtius robustus TaxID=9764 RepID=A0AB34GB78_ESCRO|nr:hypothetical protein J1605_015313 [Eschrichtius robustus]
MLAAGAENTGLTSARKGSCPAGLSKGRAVAEEGGGGSEVVRATVLPCTPHPPCATLPLPNPRTPAPARLLPGLDQHRGATRAIASARPFLGPLCLLLWETPGIQDPELQEPLCVGASQSRSTSRTSGSQPCHPGGQMLWPGDQAGPGPRNPPG